jgi:ferredoxin-NADP reductase
MIEKYVDDIENSMYYIVGTKVFTESMKEILEEMNIDKEHMQFDNFG